jgi:hypothetical protein
MKKIPTVIELNGTSLLVAAEREHILDAANRWSAYRGGDKDVYGGANSDIGSGTDVIRLDLGLAQRDRDRELLADCYCADNEPIPFESYLGFANEMIVKDCGLGYDVAVVIAKEMHKRKMVLPELKK